MDMLLNKPAAESIIQPQDPVQLRTLQDLELALIGGGSGDVIFA